MSAAAGERRAPPLVQASMRLRTSILLLVQTSMLLQTSVAFLLLAPPRIASGRGSVSGLAEADASSLSARGIDSPFGNPATLAWDRSLTIGFASAAAQIQNDTYTWDDYRRWNGARWSEADKRAILGRIEGGKVHGRLETGLHPPGVAWSGWALTIRRLQAAVLDIPRAYAELAFFGNRLGQEPVLPNSTGEGVQLLDIAISHGRRLGTLRGLEVSAGANAHWLRGTDLHELVETHGSFLTSFDVLDGEIVATSRTAGGGHGIALDLGLAVRSSSEPQRASRASGVHGPYELGLTLRSAVGSIRWSRNPRLHEDRAAADSLNLEDSGDGDLIETASTATQIDPFTRSLPRELTAAGAFWISQLRLEVDWTQGFDEGARITKAPRAALGASLWRWRWITPRVGIAVGGIDGPVLAGGVRARFWRCSLDLAYQSLGSLHLFLPKGIGLGAALTLHPLGRPPTP